MIGKTVSTGEGFVPADQLQKVDDVSNLLDSSLMETMVGGHDWFEETPNRTLTEPSGVWCRPSRTPNRRPLHGWDEENMTTLEENSDAQEQQS